MRIDQVGKILDTLEENYTEGSIEGLIVIVLDKSGTMSVGYTDNLGYVQRLGLLEASKMTIERSTDPENRFNV